MPYSIEELEQLIAKWAEDRNLIKGSNPIAQLSKTLEECGELLSALNARETYDPEVRGHDIDEIATWYENNACEIQDAYGDILVTLIVGMQQLDMDIAEVLTIAYHEIKDRKGRMVNGLFIKEA